MHTTDTAAHLTADLLRYIATHPWDTTAPAANGTDEEVEAFIRIFMVPQQDINYTTSSYGLKHACERAIGHIFHGTTSYHYVSNEQFKRAMHHLGYQWQDADPDAVNEYYAFHWRTGAQELFDITGIFGGSDNVLAEQ